MGRQGVSARLVQAVKDIFGIEVKVELAVAGDQEARLAALREERRKAQEQAYTLAQLQQSAPAEKQPRKEPAEKREHKPAEKRDKPEAEAKPRAPLAPMMTDHALGKPILGRAIAERPVEMKELTSNAGLVTVQGDIFKLETKELKGGELLLLTFAITDYTSSILCKTFLRYRNRFGRKKDDDAPPEPITAEERKAVMDKVEQIKVGMNVKVRGECLYDNFAHELSISVRDVVPMERVEREDTAEEKRVELHMHTNMSTMDALTPAGDLIKRAIKWGHPAVAITDHGVVQSFPAAFNAVKGKDIKLIPGCEGYLIDEAEIVQDPDDRDFDEPIIVLDFESTGLNTNTARVIEIGAVKLVGGTVTDSMSILVNPKQPLKPKITEITGITDMMLADKETAETAIPKLMEFIGDCPIAAHNANYDASLLRAELRRLGLQWQAPVLDTLTFARKLYPDMKSHKLGSVCKHLGVSLKNAHRAVHDATATALCLAKMYKEARERGINTLRGLNEALKGGAIGESFHIILLVKTQKGMENLNRLVSIGAPGLFPPPPPHAPALHPEVPGGAHRGQRLRGRGAVPRGAGRGKLRQSSRRSPGSTTTWRSSPSATTPSWCARGRWPTTRDCAELNRTIVRLGEELGMPVVATGDVHFLDPHDAINRAIILMAGQGFEDCDQQPPLYFRTTERDAGGIRLPGRGEGPGGGH